jgi:hypothetical protein
MYSPEALPAAAAAAAGAAKQQVGLKRHAMPSLTSWPPTEVVFSAFHQAGDQSPSDTSDQQHHGMLPLQPGAVPTATAAVATCLAPPCPSFEMLDAMNTLEPLNTLELLTAAGEFGGEQLQQWQQQQQQQPQALGFMESLLWEQMLARVSAQHQPEAPEQQRQQWLDGAAVPAAAAAAAAVTCEAPGNLLLRLDGEGMVASWQVDNTLSMHLGESLDLTGAA